MCIKKFCKQHIALNAAGASSNYASHYATQSHRFISDGMRKLGDGKTMNEQRAEFRRLIDDYQKKVQSIKKAARR
jgi:hypothetical protein